MLAILIIILTIYNNYTLTANLLLQNTIERIYIGKQYGDIPRGIFLVRGENMVLCGEIVGRVKIYCSATCILVNVLGVEPLLEGHSEIRTPL